MVYIQPHGKVKKIEIGYFDTMNVMYSNKIKLFWGDLTDIPVKIKTLVRAAFMFVYLHVYIGHISVITL